MTTQANAAASADRASMNYTKDAYGITPLATLSGINLNNRKVASQYYEDTRTAMIRRLQMVDGLYDLAVDFGSKSDSSVPWGASKKVKLKSYNKQRHPVLINLIGFDCGQVRPPRVAIHMLPKLMPSTLLSWVSWALTIACWYCSNASS